MVQKIRKIQKQKNMMAAACVAAVLMMSLVVGAAQAAPLGLNLNSYPDITSNYITTVYDAGTDLFTANGFPDELFDGSNYENIQSGDFVLSATIDIDGNFSGGTLSITGTVDALSFNSGLLLIGTLTAFGFDGANDPFEFLFDVTGGDAASLYGPIGGVILTSTSTLSFSGSFINNFESDEMSERSDTAPVPEPSTMLLLGAGLIGLVGLRRKKIKK